MLIQNLGDFDEKSDFETDLIVVGGGPTGLTIAQEFAGFHKNVLVLESGLFDEHPDYAALAQVESVGEPKTDEQRRKRIIFHGGSSAHWSQDLQPFGVRCRALGGSSHAWAGKSAPFDAIDFEQRPWVEHSGWPVTKDQIDPFVDRAVAVLNLSVKQPDTIFDEENVRSFFWQFSRSRVDKFDIMRFGREIKNVEADNVKILLNATATNIRLSENGTRFSRVDIQDISGRKFSVTAKVIILAASGIENPRLLLASKTTDPNGIGNSHDVVGRFLMDHPGARVAQVSPDSARPFMKKFGFRSVQEGARAHIFMHGLSLTPEVQEREGLLNAAVYFITQQAPDDPWDALKRLIRRSSDAPLKDVIALVSGAGLLAKGGAMSVLASKYTPQGVKELIINAAIRLAPNTVAEDFQTHGVPHKITGLSLDAISEQIPNANSRITLSGQADRLGVPMAKVDWKINDVELRTLTRIANLTRDMFSDLGLPELPLEDWVRSERSTGGIIIDMAHTLGTTRMADDPREGVVDQNCKVHGVEGLYVAGGSVFPTSGHANPTLMMLAMAIRLADHLKAQF